MLYIHLHVCVFLHPIQALPHSLAPGHGNSHRAPWGLHYKMSPVFHCLGSYKQPLRLRSVGSWFVRRYSQQVGIGEWGSGVRKGGGPPRVWWQTGPSAGNWYRTGNSADSTAHTSEVAPSGVRDLEDLYSLFSVLSSTLPVPRDITSQHSQLLGYRAKCGPTGWGLVKGRHRCQLLGAKHTGAYLDEKGKETEGRWMEPCQLLLHMHNSNPHEI